MNYDLFNGLKGIGHEYTYHTLILLIYLTNKHWCEPPRLHDTSEAFSIFVCSQENVLETQLLLTISASSVDKAWKDVARILWVRRTRPTHSGCRGCHHAHIPPRKSGKIAPGRPPHEISLSSRYATKPLSPADFFRSFAEQYLLHSSALNLAQFVATLSENISADVSHWVISKASIVEFCDVGGWLHLRLVLSLGRRQTKCER